MTRLLSAIFVVIFASTMFIRSVDPLVAVISADLAVSPDKVAMLSTAFALPYALMQPILGAAADLFGKIKLMIGCVAVLMLTAFAAATAPNYEALLAARILGGMAAGGTFPIAVAIVGDMIPVERRQVAVGRLLAAGMTGNLFGSMAAGVIGDLIGWRPVMLVLGCFGVLALAGAIVGMRGISEPKPAAQGMATVWTNYRTIFSNPLAKFCFGTVLIEGVCLFGLFPYVALLLREVGETRATIAGLVIAGFGMGGVLYAFAVSWLVSSLGERRMMRGGGFVMGFSLFLVGLGLSWPIDMAAFVIFGFGFYMLHGVVQIYVTELAPKARGSAMALHSFFFFIGQAIGPPLYGVGLSQVGKLPSLLIAGAALITAGIICAHHLRRRSPE
jgi:predicted MFS family arabinose efflux permease